jgi:hypothetical protein
VILPGKTLGEGPEPGRAFRIQINDGSERDPRLVVGASDWAMTGLMGDASLEARLARAAEDGAEFYEGRWDDPDQAAEAAEFARARDIRLIYQIRVGDPGELDDQLEAAAAADPLAVNCHIFNAHLDEMRSAELVETINHKCESAGLPLLVETHRGCVTQDLLRTLRFADRCTCRLNLDFSHWAVAGEMTDGPDDDLRDRLRPLLSRVGMIHGRISNGQQVQVSARQAGEPAVIAYQKLWATAMGLWRRNARPGDVFLFEPELGPPPYAVVDAAGREVINRRGEAEELIRLARNAWKAVQTI